MKLVFEDMSWNGLRLQEHRHFVINRISDSLKKHGIKSSIALKDGGFFFKPVHEGKLFSSIEENKIKLAKKDPRIKTLKRDYLNTNRLTKEQYTKLMSSLQEPLDILGLSATIIYYEFDDDDNAFFYLRKGKEKNAMDININYIEERE